MNEQRWDTLNYRCFEAGCLLFPHKKLDLSCAGVRHKSDDLDVHSHCRIPELKGVPNHRVMVPCLLGKHSRWCSVTKCLWSFAKSEICDGLPIYAYE